MFSNIYKNKKVLVTGHTGFKGAWLSTWLLQLGANVIGLSKDIPTEPALFDCLQLKNKITHYIADLRDLESIKSILDDERPEFIFHLAAQSIVSESYRAPIDSILSNVVGTANILEGLRLLDYPCVIVLITSDKAYDNVEQIWGYKEDDHLGGKDIYSGSKGAAELIIKSYFNSFFKKENSNIKLGIARAGNVVGGGDWAKDRIVVDCMRAWSKKNKVVIRCPYATRPWQHVLEPLSGYLSLGARLYNNELHGEAFNFGPKAEQNRTVLELLQSLSLVWNISCFDNTYSIENAMSFHEAELLKLNCDKALGYLSWQATLDYDTTVLFIGEWYYDYYMGCNVDMWNKTCEQMAVYQDIAKRKGLAWME